MYCQPAPPPLPPCDTGPRLPGTHTDGGTSRGRARGQGDVPVTVFGMTTLEALDLTALSAATGPAPLSREIGGHCDAVVRRRNRHRPRRDRRHGEGHRRTICQPAPPPLPEPTQPPLLALTLTVAPPEGAPGAVPVTVFGMTTLEALRLTALSAATGPAPLTVRLAVFVTPFVRRRNRHRPRRDRRGR